MLQELSAEATKQATKPLRYHKLVGTITEQSASTATTETVAVTGVIQLPTSLPPGIIGLKAAMRRGVFATGRVTVRDAAGQILEEQEAELQWDDAYWTIGARNRRNQPLDDVLAHFVRNTADHAIRELKSSLTAKR